MRFLPLLILVALTFRADARPGLLQTVDGRALNGDVAFTNGTFIVDATNSVPLTNLLALSFASLPAPEAFAQGTGKGLLGFYFSNTNFAGDVVVRLDETINFDWGSAEPAPDVPADQFSVAWCGELEAPATGDYQFAIAAGDGARLSLADKVVVDSGPVGEASEVQSSAIALQAGVRYPIQFRYSHSSGQARARLLWSGPNIPRGILPRDRLHPKSALDGHTATLALPTSGLLGTYYTKSDFTGKTWTRIDPTIDFEWSNLDPMPGVARTNFAVRWSGQILADRSETYTFYVLADEPARLWLNGKLLIATGGDSFFFERRDSISLNGGERHDLRLETQSTSGNATIKLAWSSASTPKAPVPATHLFPSRPTPTRRPTIDLAHMTPPGILLRNGSFLAGAVERATESSLRMSGRDAPVSTVNIARIHFRALSRQLNDYMPPGRAGLLLAKGDFVDAEFKGIENGRLRTSSILFGPHDYDTGAEVVAVALRHSAVSAFAMEVRLLDGTWLYASDITAERDGLVVRDAMAGTMKVAFADLAQIRRAR